MRQLGFAAMAVAAVMLLSGCGGGGDYSTPTATFNTMWAAAKAGNKDAMLACFSDDCRKKITEMEKLMSDPSMKGDKDDMMSEMMKKAKDAKTEIGAEKIDGEKATLEVTTDGKKESLNFIKEGGAWKFHVAEIAAIDVEGMKKMMEAMKNMTK